MIVTIFGASKIKEGEAEYERARELGSLLARAGHTVCTGGYKGIMAAASRGAKEAGGKVIGITTSQFPGTVNEWVDKETSFPTWQARLHELIEVGDAYVVFEGGTGTLVEFFVVWEMASKNMHQKPIVLIGDLPKSLFRNLQKEPFIIPNDYLHCVDAPEDVLKYLTHEPI